MKTIRLLPLLLAFAGTMIAEAPPAQLDGFLGIAWGTAQEPAKKQLVARTHARFDKTKGSSDELWFSGGKFAGFKAATFVLHFASDRLFKADIVLEPLSKNHEKEFSTFRQLLVEKYGPPTSDTTEGKDTIAEWYLDGPPGVDKDKVNLNTDLGGTGAKIFYAADRIAHTPVAAAKAPAAESKAKPIPVSPTAKDDL